ncbi:hypothetical protein I4641_14445 [Waterburya agarophytonicola K14]|uniref:Uncharacterized protein n=1 Tax=Waterburya agarophytonicola KI4 TaxID=2874699 RepID=A0A964BS58_9CYAN|nr:hypothetical protein [Waterburya agarophytonicola]MCC0178179.1 hypothetical protein [Waterburya agarophytonicola KI4]
MKIENIRKETQGDKVKIIAEMIWENCDRPNQDIYFETTTEFADDFYLNPNTFLLACTLPAMRYGEQRIALSEPICSEVKDGLINAMKCLINWHGGDRQVITIEAPVQTKVLFPDKPPKAGALFSGGIDALAMLRDNHLRFPQDHPRHIQDGILVYGILEGESNTDPSFQNVINAVSAMAKDAGIGLIQVSTNVYASFRDLDPEFKFWRLEYIGSFLAAIAHTFAPRFTTVSIASTYDYANLDPWGSHPLIDPLYSNTGLQIRHENAALSRLEKTKLVGEWDVALKHLRVCNEKSSYSQGNYNCGKCDKCVKTMTALVALDLLKNTATFTEQDVSKELLISNCYLSDAYGESTYLELIEPLTKLGRQDLVDGINFVIRRYHEKDLKGLIKRFDRTFFDGNLLSTGKNLLKQK